LIADMTRFAMQRESILIGIRSQREAPRVRFERSDAIAPGTIVIVVVRGELIVRCTSSAAVEAMAFGGVATSPSAMTLRDAGVELTVSAGDAESDPQIDLTLDDTPIEARVVPRKEPPENLVTTVRAPAGLVVREAEWQPAPAREPPPIHDETGEAPTRMQLLSDVLPEGLPPTVASAPPAPAKPPVVDARRQRLRRIALGAMLACSFVIAMRAIRLHKARVARAAAAAHIHPSASAQSVVARQVSDPAPALPEATLAPRRSWTTAASDPASARKEGSVTKARRAADALANGAFAESASLYDDLAADHPGNPAYARAAHILRARLDSPR
jgi:hypothetical protein